MSPLKIRMMLHYHCIHGPFDEPSDAATEAMDFFREMGLVKEPVNLDCVELSGRGKAYIHFLTTLPLPVANWAIPGYQCELPKEDDGTR